MRLQGSEIIAFTALINFPSETPLSLGDFPLTQLGMSWGSSKFMNAVPRIAITEADWANLLMANERPSEIKLLLSAITAILFSVLNVCEKPLSNSINSGKECTIQKFSFICAMLAVFCCFKSLTSLRSGKLQ